MIRKMALVPLLGLATSLANAGELDGFYVSEFDFQLMEQGLIIPIVEYVEITDGPNGKSHLEVGYTHLIGDAEHFITSFLAWELDEGLSLDELGDIDLERLSRIVVAGTLAVGTDRLVWHADTFLPTLHEPSRMPEMGTVYPSPFQAATAAAAGNSAPAEAGYTLSGDSLHVTGPGGRPYGHYRRIDPMVLRWGGLLATFATVSYAANHTCLMGIAEDIVADRPHVFSDAAIAAWQEEVDDDKDRLQTWLAVREQGPGALLNRFAAAAWEAFGHISRFMQAAIDAEGGLEAFAAASAAYELPPEMSIHLRLIRDFHYFDYDYTDLVRLPFDQFPDFIASHVDRYRADPWSETGPFVSAYVGAGWVSQVIQLVAHECSDRI